MTVEASEWSAGGVGAVAEVEDDSDSGAESGVAVDDDAVDAAEATSAPAPCPSYPPSCEANAYTVPSHDDAKYTVPSASTAQEGSISCSGPSSPPLP